MGMEVGGASGWGTHVNPWLIHVNVWQKPLQYCKEEFFDEFYADEILIVQAIHTSVSEDDSSSEYSSDSDYVNVRPTKRQKNLND